MSYLPEGLDAGALIHCLIPLWSRTARSSINLLPPTHTFTCTGAKQLSQYQRSCRAKREKTHDTYLRHDAVRTGGGAVAETEVGCANLSEAPQALAVAALPSSSFMRHFPPVFPSSDRVIKGGVHLYCSHCLA